MGLFDNWFGNTGDKKTQPKIKFGRYSDSYKTEEQYEAWQRSLDKFEEGNYFDAYEDFFFYLGDAKEENVVYERTGATSFTFELYQGSQVIKGYVDDKKFRAETKVATAKSLHIGFMRRLLEKNFTLQYSGFALDTQNDIFVVFDTFIIDGSPQKLYHALNEMATNADKMDDLLITEFDVLNIAESNHITVIDESEKEIKYQYTQNTLQNAFKNIETGKLDANIYPQAIGYILLDAIYKIDYLIRPEGYMMESIERINREYFLNNQRSVVEKNKTFLLELEELQKRSKTDFFKELYSTKSTFGVTQVVNHERLSTFIEEVIKEHDWYLKNGHDVIALAMTGYIVGYSLFYWALPKPCKMLFHLYYEIIEHEYFATLGFEYEYWKNKELNKSAIKRKIAEIIKTNKEQFYDLSADTSLLEYENIYDFSRSFLEMVQEMEIDPKPLV